MIKKIFNSVSVLNKESQNKFFIILILVIIGSFLETLSIYLIYQTIQYFSNSAIYISNDNLFLSFFYKFNFFDLDLTFFLLLILISIFFIKFIFFSILYYFQFRFVNLINVNISTKILKNYLLQNFEFHLKSDSSKLLRNIRDEVSQFTHGSMLQTLNLITESIIFLSIIFLLLYFETEFVLFSSGIILFISAIYYILVKSVFKKWGEIRQKFASISLKNAMEAIHGIKDIKIFKSENFFLKNYFESMKMLARANIIITTLNQIPRLLLEVFIIIIVCLFIINNFDGNIIETNLLSSLGLFIAASFRLIPSTTRILNSLNNLKYNLPATHVVKKELSLDKMFLSHKIKNSLELNFKRELKIESLSFKYPDRDNFIFEEINLIIKKNSIIGIKGESGSGKSTLIDLIIGLQYPTKGEIIVDGKNININYAKWLDKIGYVPQKVYITNDTLKKNIALGLNEHQIDNGKIQKVIHDCQLVDLIKKFPNDTETKLGDRGIIISGGELQRIGIARALYKNSEILILDEFTSALDEYNETKLFEIIKQLSNTKTIIISSHNKKLFGFCDRVFLIKDKKVIIENE